MRQLLLAIISSVAIVSGCGRQSDSPLPYVVIACNSHSPDSNARLLDLIWKHIVPYL